MRKDILRNIIREVVEETFLINERLMHVDDDVDLIYNMFFKEDIDMINLSGFINENMFKRSEITTFDLKSPLAEKANKENNCKILINKYGSNFYNPEGKLISCAINSGAVRYVIGEFRGSLDDAVRSFKLGGDMRKASMLLSEFTEAKMKGSIHHELAHWIDDTLHNNHIKNRADKVGEIKKDMTKRGLPINADKMEIQGQIHNIAQLKKQHLDNWDELTFKDVIALSTTISVIDNQLKGDIRKQWLRDLKTRMHREGLLGKSMYD
jgi:hypothetical protein